MIENKLTQQELLRLVRPLLRLEPASAILGAFQDVLGFPTLTANDIVCQNKILLTFEGYRLDIQYLREIAPGANCIIMQFKAKQRWWHGLFRDQNAIIVCALQAICCAEIADLDFARFETTVPWSFLRNRPIQYVYIHDSQALNRGYRIGYDISPLMISPDCHDGNCFVEFLFNAAAYQRSDNTTTLKDDWLASAFSVSDDIERGARRLRGLE